jgi:hypothetical protein
MKKLYQVALLFCTGILFVCGPAYSNEIKWQKEQKSGINTHDPAKLNFVDKSQLVEFYRVKKQIGGRVWPDFDTADIPVILYNEMYEFLIGFPDPPSPWLVVDNDFFQGSAYFRRDSQNSQAFAVSVGNLWAASLNTLGSMNRSIKEQIQEEMPPEKITPAFLRMMEITPGYHVVALLHEAFHAFQAMEAIARFKNANTVYSHEKLYPFENENFKKSWNHEGVLLVKAAREKNEQEKIALIRKFLENRHRRRSSASLSPELIRFEQELEWLEGVAKYVEMRFAELCYSQNKKDESKAYNVVRGRLRSDFFSRLRKLGTQKGDLRYYLSGAVQAMILDELSPGWKSKFLSQEKITLENLLKEAVDSK